MIVGYCTPVGTHQGDPLGPGSVAAYAYSAAVQTEGDTGYAEKAAGKTSSDNAVSAVIVNDETANVAGRTNPYDALENGSVFNSDYGSRLNVSPSVELGIQIIC